MTNNRQQQQYGSSREDSQMKLASGSKMPPNKSTRPSTERSAESVDGRYEGQSKQASSSSRQESSQGRNRPSSILGDEDESYGE